MTGVFGIGAVRKLLGPKRDAEAGECRRLQNEELHDPYSLPRYSVNLYAFHLIVLSNGRMYVRV